MQLNYDEIRKDLSDAINIARNGFCDGMTALASGAERDVFRHRSVVIKQYRDVDANTIAHAQKCQHISGLARDSGINFAPTLDVLILGTGDDTKLWTFEPYIEGVELVSSYEKGKELHEKLPLLLNVGVKGLKKLYKDCKKIEKDFGLTTDTASCNFIISGKDIVMLDLSLVEDSAPPADGKIKTPIGLITRLLLADARKQLLYNMKHRPAYCRENDLAKLYNKYVSNVMGALGELGVTAQSLNIIEKMKVDTEANKKPIRRAEQ